MPHSATEIHRAWSEDLIHASMSYYVYPVGEGLSVNGFNRSLFMYC